MDHFDYEITHVPGKELYTADALSCAPSMPVKDAGDDEDVQFFADLVTANLPTSEDRLAAYSETQQEDTVAGILLL